jgi:hypothetical protein
MWIDTHCHLDADEFDRDRDAVVARARAAGVSMVVMPTGHFDERDKAAAVAAQHGFAYALGIHPLWLADAVPADIERLRAMVPGALADPRFVAIGEIGIDLFEHGESGADPQRQVPIPIWMHRGCTPFISKRHFETIYWPTLKPIVEALWAQGNQTLFYAEGKWDAHLESFAELPAGSIVYHLDRTDPALAQRVLGRKFCLSGGVPNSLLTFGTPEEVKAECRKLIEMLAAEGGYLLDASAILQNDAKLENINAMRDSAREYGIYRSASSPAGVTAAPPAATPGIPAWVSKAQTHPGVCIPFEEKLKDMPPISGDPELVRRVWNDVEGFAYMYIWHVLLSF